MGERVQVRWYSGNKLQWRFGTISRKYGKLHYEVKLDNGYSIKRHINQIRSTLVKPLPERSEQKNQTQKPEKANCEMEKFDLSELFLNPPAINFPEIIQPEVDEQILRRSNRERKPPVRFQEYVSC